MADQDSWESKRAEVWQRIVNTESVLEGLKQKLAEVEVVANNKISENEKTAAEAAEKAATGAIQVLDILDRANGLATHVASFQQSFAEATTNIASIKKQTDEVIANSQSIVAAKATSENATKEITTLQEKAKKLAEEAEAKWTTTNQQVQNIANLNAQATADAATAKTARETLEKLHKEIAQIKTDFETMKTEWDQLLDDLNSQHDKSLKELYVGREQELNMLLEIKNKQLSELDKKYEQEFEEKKKKIESLLPGATTAGLSSAFARRRWMFYVTKFGWGILLFISVLALVAFGGIIISSKFAEYLGITMLPANEAGNNWYGRAIVFAALILFEEFARRNFNIVSRLEEAYAYKEVIARSYLGYKEQMQGIKWPRQTEDSPDSTSILVKVFLNQLADEPGKHVFDKEKHVIGIGAAMDKLSPNNPDGAAGKAVEELSKGNLLTRISWPIVAVVAILAITACVIAYLMRGLFI